jgi:hypothetical protein
MKNVTNETKVQADIFKIEAFFLFLCNLIATSCDTRFKDLETACEGGEGGLSLIQTLAR